MELLVNESCGTMTCNGCLMDVEYLKKGNSSMAGGDRLLCIDDLRSVTYILSGSA